MSWLKNIAAFWPHLAAAFHFLAVLLASAHALLHKRDSRAAALWLGIVWFLPIFGPLLYLTLGVNRIRRKAIALRVRAKYPRRIPEDLGEQGSRADHDLHQLAGAVSRVVSRPLASGNRIRMLVNGDEAFPKMIQAIDSAEKSISLSTYIFDNDETGGQFVDALKHAVERGVETRVLIDAAGSRYSWPPVTGKLRKAGIPTAKFLPSSLLAPWQVATINLRNHRKSLIVDGRLGFTGGMNIRHGHCVLAKPQRPVCDLHFAVEGPVVAQLQEAFANDWAFTTGEVLKNRIWFPELAEAGHVVARAITDGPDSDFEKLRWTLLAALAAAQSTVQILTPYFVPDVALITALNLAALRGIRVDIILPGTNNLPFMQWASRAMWWQVLERGCRIWLTKPPFDHSKLMIVDSHWVLFGSANWDTRSLRLNFELNVEAYGREFAKEIETVVRQKLKDAREVTLAEADSRSFPVKLRDATARLFSPYL